MDRFTRENPEHICNPVVLMCTAANMLEVGYQEQTLSHEDCVKAFTPLAKFMGQPDQLAVRSKFFIELPVERYAEDPDSFSPSEEAYVAAYWFRQHKAYRQGPGHWVGGATESPMVETPFFHILTAYLTLKECGLPRLPLAKVISHEELSTAMGLFYKQPETLGLAGKDAKLFEERAVKLLRELDDETCQEEVKVKHADDDAMKDNQDQKPAATQPDLMAKPQAAPQKSGISDAFGKLKT